MDGDTHVKPTGALTGVDLHLALAEAHDAWLVLDDAHGFGVLGPQGQGALAHLIASGVDAHLRCAASESAGAAAASWLVSAPLWRARFNLKSV